MKYFDAVKVENIEIKITEDAKPFLASAAINSDGENYYDFQKTITTKYTCVINAETNVVRYIAEDASAISPGAGERIFGIDEITVEGSATGDLAFDGTWKFNEETLAFYQDMALVAERALRIIKRRSTACYVFVLMLLSRCSLLHHLALQQMSKKTGWQYCSNIPLIC